MDADYASGIGPNALIQGGQVRRASRSASSSEQAVLRVDNGTVVNNGSRTLRGSAKIRTREAYGQGNVRHRRTAARAEALGLRPRRRARPLRLLGAPAADQTARLTIAGLASAYAARTRVLRVAGVLHRRRSEPAAMAPGRCV